MYIDAIKNYQANLIKAESYGKNSRRGSTQNLCMLNRSVKFTGIESDDKKINSAKKRLGSPTRTNTTKGMGLSGIASQKMLEDKIKESEILCQEDYDFIESFSDKVYKKSDEYPNGSEDKNNPENSEENPQKKNQKLSFDSEINVLFNKDADGKSTPTMKNKSDSDNPTTPKLSGYEKGYMTGRNNQKCSGKVGFGMSSFTNSSSSKNYIDSPSKQEIE